MSLRLLAGLIAVLLLAPRTSEAAAIILDDARLIDGVANARDFDIAGLLLGSDDDDFSQMATAGSPWASTDGAVASVATAIASSNATQNSYAGPLAFGGSGTADASAVAGEFDYAFGSARSFFYVLFMLTDQSYHFDYSAVVAAASDGITDSSYGAANSYLYDVGAMTMIAGSAVSANASQSVPDADATLLSGLLLPDTYLFFADARTQAAAGTSSGVGLSDAGSGQFNVSLTLTPNDVTPVPEPTTLWLLGSGVAAAVARRRRVSQSRRRQ